MPSLASGRSVAAAGLDALSLGYEEQAFLDAAPCPLRSGWYPGYAGLMDKVLLGMCDAGYFRHNVELPDVVEDLISRYAWQQLESNET